MEIPSGKTNSRNRLHSRENREGVKAWLNPFGYGWERVSYWLQRLTGIFLLLYFIGHVFETSSIIGGPDVWNSMLRANSDYMGSPLFNIGHWDQVLFIQLMESG